MGLVASPPISSSRYAPYKQGTEKPSITYCLQPPSPFPTANAALILEPLFPVLMIGARQSTPMGANGGENVKLNLKGAASCTFWLSIG